MFVFNRFITKYYPDFFQLSDSEKDQFKTDHYEEMEDNLTLMLYKQLLNISLKNVNDAENYEHLVKDEILLEFNRQRTYLRGIGKNYFHLNEFFAEDENMLTFKTLYDFDLDNHEFQEQATIDDENFPNKTTKELYKMRMNYYWARAIIENDFYYLSLASPGIYLHNKIEEDLREFIEKLIPHEYVEGEDFGRGSDGLFTLDYRIEANGKEKELEDLKDYYNFKISNSLYEDLMNYFFNNPKNKIWIEKSNSNDNTDPHLSYIFSDIDVIKNIRFDNWEEDTKKYITEDFSDLDLIYHKKFEKYKTELELVYNQIMEGTYVSDIKKSKPLRIIASDQALDDLNNIFNDEED